MKMSKFQLAFIILSIATIIWGIAFHYTLHGYHEYCEWFDERQLSEWGLRELRKPYWCWNGGRCVLVIGGFLILAWGVFFGKLLTRNPRLKGLKDKKKPTVESVGGVFTA